MLRQHFQFILHYVSLSFKDIKCVFSIGFLLMEMWSYNKLFSVLKCFFFFVGLQLMIFILVKYVHHNFSQPNMTLEMRLLSDPQSKTQR